VQAGRGSALIRSIDKLEALSHGGDGSFGYGDSGVWALTLPDSC